jgi:hypothetical protein
MTAREPTLPDLPTHYSLAQVAVMFHQPPNKIKARCAKGEFDYYVGIDGRMKISRESILTHLRELEIKNNK